MRWFSVLVVSCLAAFCYSPQVDEFKIPRPSEVRTWVDDSGDYSTQASYKSSDASNVVLVLASSKKERTVLLSRLSQKDQGIIKCFEVPPSNPSAAVLLGDVSEVTDGDTVQFRTIWGETVKVRMSDIDAPEFNQPYGLDSTNAIRSMVLNVQPANVMRLEVTEKDKYNRLIGTLYVNGVDINSKLIEDGMAWHYVEYSKRPELAAIETAAKNSKRGLWSTTVAAIPPWDFRHGTASTPSASTPPMLNQPTQQAPLLARSPFETPSENAKSNGVATKDRKVENVPVETTSEAVYCTETGSKYHRSGCRYLAKSKVAISLEDAMRLYTPCSVCKPPSQPVALKSDKIENVPAETKSETVYCTKTGAKYHSSGCRYLSKSKIPISLEDARKRYSPCSVCKPPNQP